MALVILLSYLENTGRSLMSAQTLENFASVVINIAKDDHSKACIKLDEYLIQIKDKSTALNNLGLLFYQHVEYEFARKTFVYAIKQDPKNHSLYNNHGLTLNRLGQGPLAVKQYKKALSLKPDYHQARSNLAYTLLYFGTTGRKEILTAHQNIAKHVFSDTKNYITYQHTQQSFDNKKRKLKIAYVTADLRNHAVGSFMFGILQNHDTERFDIHILDNRSNNNDHMAQRLKSLQKQWHDISAMDTETACQFITKLKIDILIDLSGHTKGGRLDIFSHRTAPIQITYLGYPATSGLPEVDYRIGDIFCDPLENKGQNTEQILRLHHAMWNYTPWPDMPKQYTTCPFEQQGFITFGSANNHAKLQDVWIKTWAQALKAVPDSRFHIKSRSLKSPNARQQLLHFFQNKGIKQDRISIEHYSPTKADHWQALSRFDIGFDSFPYNGTTTTCDLLNLGIPVVTRSGNSHVSRTTGSILNTLGLSSWVAINDHQFIEICQEKAQNLNELRKLRQSLRTRFSSSSLGNGKLFIVEYEKQLMSAWAEHYQHS